MEELINYLQSRGIDNTIKEGVLFIGEESCNLCGESDSGHIIDSKDFTLIDYKPEADLQIYQFGGIWYYSRSIEAEMNLLEYLGKHPQQFMKTHLEYMVLWIYCLAVECMGIG